MIKKIMTGLAVATVSLMISIGVPVFNQTAIIVEAASNVMSVEDAAKKLLKSAYKAYDEKKNVTASVTIECPNKKSVDKCRNKLAKVLAKEELGGLSNVSDLNDACERRISTENKDGVYTEMNDYKNGKLTINVIYRGKFKYWRNSHEQIVYGMQNVKELREVTAGMSEIDKAWRIAVWLMVDRGTKYSGQAQATEKDVAKNRAKGMCNTLASLYIKYANRMGIDVGRVSSNDHSINWVFIDGELYYTDMQGVDVEHYAWVDLRDGYCDNEQEVEEKHYKTFKYVEDPTGRYYKVRNDYAEAMESGEITKYPWEVSEGEYCWLTDKQAKATLPETGFGKPSKWKYSENIKKYIPDFPKKNTEDYIY